MAMFAVLASVERGMDAGNDLYMYIAAPASCTKKPGIAGLFL